MNKLVLVFLLFTSVAQASEVNLEQYIEVASLTKKAQSKVGKSVDVVDSSILEEYKPLMLTDPSDPQGSSNPLIGDLIADVDSLEILKGASSSTWGSKAIGGVVNLIPKKGCCIEGVRLTGEYGSHDTFKERIEFRTKGFYGGI